MTQKSEHPLFALSSNLKSSLEAEVKRFEEGQKNTGRIITSVCVAGTGMFLGPPIPTGKQYKLFESNEKYQEVLFWLLTIVDFSKLQFHQRNKYFKQPLFSPYISTPPNDI